MIRKGNMIQIWEHSAEAPLELRCRDVCPVKIQHEGLELTGPGLDAIRIAERPSGKLQRGQVKLKGRGRPSLNSATSGREGFLAAHLPRISRCPMRFGEVVELG